MNLESIVDRSVRSYYDCVRLNSRPIRGFNDGGISTGNFAGMCLREDSTAVAFDRSRQTIEILERMKLGLARKSQRLAGIEGWKRRARDNFEFNQTCPVCGFEFAIENVF